MSYDVACVVVPFLEHTLHKEHVYVLSREIFHIARWWPRDRSFGGCMSSTPNIFTRVACSMIIDIFTMPYLRHELSIRHPSHSWLLDCILVMCLDSQCQSIVCVSQYNNSTECSWLMESAALFSLTLLHAEFTIHWLSKRYQFIGWWPIEQLVQPPLPSAVKFKKLARFVTICGTVFAAVSNYLLLLVETFHAWLNHKPVYLYARDSEVPVFCNITFASDVQWCRLCQNPA